MSYFNKTSFCYAASQSLNSGLGRYEDLQGSQGTSLLSCQVSLSSRTSQEKRSQLSLCPSPFMQHLPRPRCTPEPCGNFQIGLNLQLLGSSPPLVSRFFLSLVSPARIMPGQDHRNKTKQHSRAQCPPLRLALSSSTTFHLPQALWGSGTPNPPGRPRRAEDRGAGSSLPQDPVIRVAF